MVVKGTCKLGNLQSGLDLLKVEYSSSLVLSSLVSFTETDSVLVVVVLVVSSGDVTIFINCVNYGTISLKDSFVSTIVAQLSA